MDLADAAAGEVVQRKDDFSALKAREFLARDGVGDGEVFENDFAGARDFDLLHIDLRAGQGFLELPAGDGCEVQGLDENDCGYGQGQKTDGKADEGKFFAHRFGEGALIGALA